MSFLYTKNNSLFKMFCLEVKLKKIVSLYIYYKEEILQVDRKMNGSLKIGLYYEVF